MIYEWTLMLAEQGKDGMHMDAVAMRDCEQTDAAASRCQRRGVEIWMQRRWRQMCKGANEATMRRSDEASEHITYQACFYACAVGPQCVRDVQ